MSYILKKCSFCKSIGMHEVFRGKDGKLYEACERCKDD